MKLLVALCLILASAIDSGSTCNICDFGAVGNPFYDCLSNFAPLMLNTLETDCVDKEGGSEFDAFLDNLVLICQLKSNVEVNLECEISCDLNACNNPAGPCLSGFPLLMQAAVLADCSAHQAAGTMEDWVANLALICSLKFGSALEDCPEPIPEPEPEPECDLCDLDAATNAFASCAGGFSGVMLEGLEADCRQKEGGPEFDAWLENLGLICALKFNLDIDATCELSCNLGACNNPARPCFESFSLLLQEAMFADCAAHEAAGTLEDWIENFTMMCSLKFDIDVLWSCSARR